MSIFKRLLVVCLLLSITACHSRKSFFVKDGSTVLLKDYGESGAVFDGELDYVTVANSDAFDFSNSKGFTLELLLKPGIKFSDPKRRRIELVNKGADSAAGGSWTLYWNNSGNDKGYLGFKIGKKAKVVASVRSKEIIMPPGAWQYIAVVLDKKNALLYQNGMLVGENSVKLLPAGNDSAIHIGTYRFDKFYFPGIIGEVKISNAPKAIKEHVDFKQPTILYESNFRKNADGWKPLSGTWKLFDKGYSELSDLKTKQGLWSIYEDKGWSDYIFEVDAYALDNIGNLLFGVNWQDINNHHEVVYKNLSSGIALIEIIQVRNGQKKLLKRVASVENKYVPRLVKKQKTRFRIERYKDKIVVLADGNYIASANVDGVSHGTIAIGENGRKAVFANVKVTLADDDFVFLIPAKDQKPYTITCIESDYRHVFERGETISLNICITNNTTTPLIGSILNVSCDNGIGFNKKFPIAGISPGERCMQNIELSTAAWKAGDYNLSVSLEYDNAVVGAGDYGLTLVKKEKDDHYQYYVWGGSSNEDVVTDYAAHGFNGMSISADMNSNYTDLKKFMAKIFDMGLKHGVKVGIQNNANWVPAENRADLKIIRADGTKGRLPNPWNPSHRNYALQKMDEMMNAFKNYPSFEFVLLSSENENVMEPSYSSADKARALKELGFNQPSPNNKEMCTDNVAGSRHLSIPESVKKKQSSVFPDNDKWYRFFKWYWQRGFGDNILNKELAKVIKQYRPDVYTTHDPFRDVSLFQRNVGLDRVGTWFYSEPSPVEAAFHSEVLKTAAGNEKRVNIGPSLWLYNNWICPAKQTFAGVQPKDYIMESLWLCLSRCPAVLEHFGVDYLRGKRSPEYVEKKLYDEMAHFAKTVLNPFWPAFSRMKQEPNPCAFLLSFGSNLYGKRTWGGTNTGTANGYFAALQMAHIPTSIVFEENILKGELDAYKILFMHHIDYLPESVFNKIKSFAAKGGVVVTGKTFAKLIPNAVEFDMNMKNWRNHSYWKLQKQMCLPAEQLHAEMEKKATILRKMFINKIKPFVDSEALDVFFNTMYYGTTKYSFVVNDKRTYGEYVGRYKAAMEKGVAQTVTVAINDSKSFVYDLLTHKLLKCIKKNGRTYVTLDLPPAGGTVLACYAEPITGIKLNTKSNCKRGERVSVVIRVITNSGQPVSGLQPLKVLIKDSKDNITEYSNFYVAENGVCKMSFMPAVNEPTGKWTISVHDLTVGLKTSKNIHIK